MLATQLFQGSGLFGWVHLGTVHRCLRNNRCHGADAVCVRCNNTLMGMYIPPSLLRAPPWVGGSVGGCKDLGPVTMSNGVQPTPGCVGVAVGVWVRPPTRSGVCADHIESATPGTCAGPSCGSLPEHAYPV